MRVPSNKASRRSWVTKTTVLRRRFCKCEEFALQFRAGDGIEGAEGFVHQEDGRIRGQSAGHAYPLPLAAGKFARIALGDLGIESDELQQLVDAFGDSIRVPLLNLRNEADIARHREVGEQADSWMT